MTIEIVSTRALRENIVETVYSAMGDEMIAAGIVPADFLDFRGSRRVCGRSWWGKKKPTHTMFPPGVTHIWLERRASGLCVAEISHEMGKPPYVPPGVTWPQPEERKPRPWEVEKEEISEEPAPCRAENEAAFRERVVVFTGASLDLIQLAVRDDAYSYDAESLTAIRLHAGRLLEAIAKGRVVKDAAPRGKVVRPDLAFWQRKSGESCKL